MTTPITTELQQKADKYAFQNCVSCSASTYDPALSCTCDQLTAAFLAGASIVQVGGCRWVKASDRMPDKVGRYAVKRLGEIMACDCRQNSNGSFVFTIPNGMPWKGYKDFEWLDESPSSSEPAEDDAISFAEWVDNRATRNDETGLWIHCLFEPNEPITSQQLYELFKQRK